MCEKLTSAVQCSICGGTENRYSIQMISIELASPASGRGMYMSYHYLIVWL